MKQYSQETYIERKNKSEMFIYVYQEVFRVLKQGGIYMISHMNPSTYPTCFDNDNDGWDGTGYRIASSPYLGGGLRIDEKGNENMIKGELTGEFSRLFIDMLCLVN